MTGAESTEFPVDLDACDGPVGVEASDLDVDHADRDNKPIVPVHLGGLPAAVVHIPREMIAPDLRDPEFLRNFAARLEQGLVPADEAQASMEAIGAALQEAFVPVRLFMEQQLKPAFEQLVDSLQALHDAFLTDCTCLGRDVRSRSRARRRCPVHRHDRPSRTDRRRQHRHAAGYQDRHCRDRRFVRRYLREKRPDVERYPAWLVTGRYQASKARLREQATAEHWYWKDGR